MSSPVWLITAASSGFGKEIALNALKKGDRVIATGRTLSKLSAVKEAGAEILQLDVTSDFETIKKTIDKAQKIYGRIDILINSAGYILEAAIEEATPKESYDIFNTNVFGTINVTRAVLPFMRAQRSGVITTFGSLGSWIGGPAYGFYVATKWACSAIGESLKQEVAPFGIDVTVIEPGYFRSGVLNPGARMLSELRIKDYDESAVGETRDLHNKLDNSQPGDVKRGVDVIVDVLTKRGVGAGKEIPLRLVLGSDCQDVIRKKLADTEKLLDEWKDISYSTDYPKDT